MPQQNALDNVFRAFEIGRGISDNIAQTRRSRIQELMNQTAGTSLAKGDYGGAAATLLRGGDLQGGMQVQQLGQNQQQITQERFHAARPSLLRAGEALLALPEGPERQAELARQQNLLRREGYAEFADQIDDDITTPTLTSEVASLRAGMPTPEAYTLNPGDVRYGGNNQPVAQAPFKPDEPPAADSVDSFRPITEEERARYGIEANTPYAINDRTGRPVAIGGTRAQEWTQGQRTGSSYVANMSDGYNRAVRMMEGGFDPRGVVGGRPRWTMSDTGRDFYRAIRDYAEGELRAETGAAATQDEIERKLEQLMAGVNEDPSNVARIFDRMRTRIGSMAAAQGGAYEALYPDLSPRELPQTYRDLLNPAGGQEQQTAPGAAPAIGTREDGYEFLGGDPADPNSWRQVN